MEVAGAGVVQPGPAIHLGGTKRSAPAWRPGDSDSNPGPREHFSLKINNIGPTD